jgi:hypothetical protein
MPKFNQTLNTSHASHVAERDVRSPRTPTYAPSSTSFFAIPPFDSSRVFAPPSPTKSVEQTPPPPKPLAWVWQCHLCHSRYPLGATRRCLLDGHYYCSGETDRPTLKKKKKGQGCSSEFDYIGWKSMEQWKRKLRKHERFIITREPEGCENCEFPSQCRYANHNLLSKDRGTSAMTEIDLSTPSHVLSASQADSLLRFYKNDNSTSESILTGSVGEASKSKQSKVTDYYQPDRKGQANAGNPSTSAILREIMKSAERRWGEQALLSPIQEEFTHVEKSLQETQDTSECFMHVLDS